MRQRDPIARLARAIGIGLSWLFAVVVLLTAYEVVMRYVFNRPTIWVHDLTIALTAICFVFGGAYALQRDDHIRITVAFTRASDRGQRRLTAFSHAATFVFLAALTYAAVIQAARSVALMETSGRAWDVPIPALLKSVLAAGSGLMALQALLSLCASLRGRR
jgi:TRAP-type C4-dicarboxylate transport system permease small subunit